MDKVVKSISSRQGMFTTGTCFMQKSSERLESSWFTMEYPKDVTMFFSTWVYQGKKINKILFLTNRFNQKYIKVDCFDCGMIIDLDDQFYFNPLEFSSEEMEKRLFMCMNIYVTGKSWTKELSKSTAKGIAQFTIEMLQNNIKNFI